MNDIPLVSICCVVYNQAPYLRQCLEGFVLQQTTFPYEILIHDDASTDGSIDILKEYESNYPGLFHILYEEENQYQKGRKGSLLFNVPRSKGQYIAFCEGDDYWTDPLKLQKQVDYMVEHPNCALCYTQAKIWLERSNSMTLDTMGDEVDFMKLLKAYNTIPSASSLYRKSMLDEYVRAICPATKGWKMGDYPQVLYFSKNNAIHFINEATCVYRIMENSASHAKNQLKILSYYYSILSIKLFFYNYYNLKDNKLLDYLLRQHLELIYEKCNKLSYCLKLQCIRSFVSRDIFIRYYWQFLKLIKRQWLKR